jgi:IclR family KDG regulon transcriptional repressor
VPATTQSVDRALEVLIAVCQRPEGAALGKISDAAGLPKSTTCRLLQGLTKYHFVTQDPHTKMYRAGLGLVSLAFRVIDKLDVRHQAQPELKELNRYLNETIHLAVLDEGEVVYIDKFESDRSIRMHSAIGRRSPVHCTGIGKVLLAFLPEEEMARVLAQRGLPRFTPNTLATLPELKDHLRGVRERGHAVDDAEFEAEIRCVAAPIRDHTGAVVAAASVAIPCARISREGIEALAPLLCQTTAAISRKMGYPGEEINRR